MSTETDAVYRERDLCVSLIAYLASALDWPCGLAQHPADDESWDADWRNIVYVELPRFGQVSWHIHDSELPYFSFLGKYDGTWDGHTTEQKYQRIADFTAHVLP